MGKNKGYTTDFPEVGSFFKLYREMMESPAYQDLSDKARFGYENIKYFHYGDNNKKIICPYSQLIHKMSPTTWARVKRELYEHGFITLEKESRGLAKEPDVFGLSNDWKWWGTDKFPERKKKRSKDPIKGFSKLWKEDRKRMMKIRRNRKKKTKE